MEFLTELFFAAVVGFLFGSYILVTTVSLPFAILYVSIIVILMIAVRIGWWILRDASVKQEQILTNQAMILGHLGEIQKTGYKLLYRGKPLPKVPDLFDEIAKDLKQREIEDKKH
jgi:hypothetical protein